MNTAQEIILGNLGREADNSVGSAKTTDAEAIIRMLHGMGYAIVCAIFAVSEKHS